MHLLVVIAHPDDESFGCGSVLARAAASGDDTVVVCATRGEAGETRIPTDDLAGVREAELRAAAEVLGVGAVQVLRYVDSGMGGEPPTDSLAACDPAQLAEEIRAIIDEVRPDVVVTLDATDGHRDHAVMRDATLAAIDGSDRPPPATYLWCLARSSMARWAERMRATGDGDAYLAIGELGTPDEEITLLVEVAEHLPTRVGGDPCPRKPGQPLRRPRTRPAARVSRRRPPPPRPRRGPPPPLNCTRREGFEPALQPAPGRPPPSPRSCRGVTSWHEASGNGTYISLGILRVCCRVAEASQRSRVPARRGCPTRFRSMSARLRHQPAARYVLRAN